MTATPNNEIFLEMKGISKRFPGVAALSNVNFRLTPGRTHALMGENGAGKSTLMKILAGLMPPDEGQIILKGREVRFADPGQAISHGIAMIHQELNPILEMTVAENLFLGREFLGRGRFIDYRAMNREAVRLLDHIGVKLDPGKLMRELTVSQMQMVEIAKVTSYDADIIIMDEPSSAITTREVEKLFEIINLLREAGKCIIYITHKMDEVFAIADEITVFRDGGYIGTYPAAEITEMELIRLMVARDLNEMFPDKNLELGPVRLKVEKLSRRGSFQDVDFEVRAGEILGLAGLVGAGRTEVVESIFGVVPPDSGTVYVDGEKIERFTPLEAIRRKIGLVTEDRKMSGLVLSMSVHDNVILPSLRRLSVMGGLLRLGRAAEETGGYLKSLRVKTSSPNELICNLSGGNQQKVILAKWLATSPSVMIFDEPTRGIDVGAKSEIYKLIVELAAKGVAVVLISSEMKEILGMCDRIMVMYQGRCTCEVPRAEATQEKLLLHATGLTGENTATPPFDPAPIMKESNRP